ncbi:PLP-dependent aminotransferase family protein [Bacillus sp. 03113]|uniref:MocR-like pyridoxine biosynthesis transcription factor PdxR n=1 Tax=Bacillus sp. 03113 TaxID=2578211 RepID=UPI00215BB278|nr:PLP-dependent aminotransferase family protein [Bacillus sp. 03113]
MKKKNEPLYVQLYRYIKNEIEIHHLKEGTKLPSIRQLAMHLKVSKTTIEEAYHQLIAEGYVESRPKSGLWVLPLDEMPIIKPAEPLISEEKTKKPPVTIDFQYGDIDNKSFPLNKWRKCISEAIDSLNHELFLYGDKQGDNELRIQIADYLQQSRGVFCHPDQILITGGTQNAISWLIQLLDLPNSIVGMENPGYDGVLSVFEQHKCHISPISIDLDGLNLEDLEKSKAALVYTTPSHQFPLGVIMSIQKRRKLLKWAYETDGYIIEDDYDGEFRYQGLPIPSLKGMDTKDRVIYLGTFSKCFLPSARISYIVLPTALLERYRTCFKPYNQSVSPIIQRAMSLFMKKGDFERHIRRMRKLYQQKQQTLLEAIAAHMGDRVRVIGEKSGLHILLEVKNKEFDMLYKKGLSKKIKVYTTSSYWTGNAEKNRALVMLGFGGLSLEEIESGIKGLADVWFK